MRLTDDQRAFAEGRHGEAAAAALRIVADTGALLGAERLIPVSSAHIDGCLYHGDSGTEFAEFLYRGGGRVRVPATLNVGSLDLLRPETVLLDGHRRQMALRLMRAYVALGCRATWTCSPYQAGHRPGAGEQVAWGESNAVAFCNSVLGARTNRYGDFLDIACTITGYAPEYGLHVKANRAAKVLFTTDAVSDRLKGEDAFWPVIGALFGRRVGDAVGAVDGLGGFAGEDRMKAFGAAAASFGSVALFHIIGATPEAPTRDAAFQGAAPEEIVAIGPAELRQALDWLSTSAGGAVTAIGIGSPHLSLAEFENLLAELRGRTARLPFYANTGRHVVQRLDELGYRQQLDAAGVTIVADTCIVTTPIIADGHGVLMTNSAKFAHYAPGNIGHEVLYGSLSDCVETAVAGRVVRDPALWR
ncbi:MAG: DUF521 domain-containing protein [Inquilinus sp.]|nr:DUF521 domain-containing protein [Inquilinus sp.]